MVTRVQRSVLPTAIEGNFAQDHTTTTGLTFGYQLGSAAVDGVRTDIIAGTVACMNGTNWIYIDLSSTPVVSVATSAPSQRETVFLFIVTCNTQDIVDVQDVRNWLTSTTIVV